MDWKTEINKLIGGGVSVRDISERTGLAVSSVYDLKNGYSAEPKGMAAVELYALIGENSKKVGSRKAAKAE